MATTVPGGAPPDDDADGRPLRRSLPGGFGRNGENRWILWFWLCGVGILGLGWAFSRLSSLITMIVVALFLAVILEPPVNWMQRRGVKRGVGTILCFVAIIVVLGALVLSMGRLLISEIASLAEKLPIWIDQTVGRINDATGAALSSEELSGQLAAPDGFIRSWLDDVALWIASFAISSLGAALSLFTIFLFTFYLVAQGPQLRRTVCSLFRPDVQRQVLESWELVIDKTSKYIGARVALGGICAVSTYIALRIIGLPDAMALALFVGVVSQFVPTVGTYIAGTVPVLVGFAEDPRKGLAVLVFVLVYQQIENLVWEPRINARAMEMNPGLAFGMVIAGGALFGGLGAVMALPVAAVLMAMASTYLERYEVVESDLTEEYVMGESVADRALHTGRRVLWSIAPDALRESVRRRSGGDRGDGGDGGDGEQAT